MRVLVIGGTLFIGRLLVGRLLAEGHDVTVLHRGENHGFGPAVGNLRADRNDAESLRSVLSGRRFDAVFDNVYDWQRGTTAEQVAAAARACGDGLTRYVYMSSVAAYGDGLDHREEDDLAPDDYPDAYCRNKAMSERILFAMHREEGFPVVTLRPPYIYGPGNPFYREAFFWDRLAEDRPIIVPGDGTRLMQFVYVKDLVTAALQAMTRQEAVGQAFNVANPAPVSQADLVRALAEAAGKEARLVYVPRERIVAAGGDQMGPENLYFAVYFDMPAISQVTTKVEELLGIEATSFATGLSETYAWHSKHHQRPSLDFSFEDSLIRFANI